MIYIVICSVILLGAVLYGIWTARKMKKSKDVMSFKEALDLTELPVVTFYNGETKLNFMLDTGSNHCILNKSVVTSLSKYKTTNMKSPGLVTGSSSNDIPMDIITLTLNYKNRVFMENFTVIDMDEPFNAIKQESGVTIHGILGNCFFTKYKYVLDFDEMIFYMK